MTDTQYLVLCFAALCAMLVAAAGFANVSRLPKPTAQFLVGALIGHGVVALGVDTGLRYNHFNDLAFNLFLPILIFVAVMGLKLSLFRAALPGILVLTFVGIFITAALVAIGVFYGIGHASGFPWPAALLTGVLLAATDPAAVTSQSHHDLNDRQERTAVLLEGESLLNDAVSVVLFSIVLTVALGAAGVAGNDLSAGEVGTLFARETIGGALIGLAVGYVARFALSHTSFEDASAWLSLVAAFGSYHLAVAFHASGVVACLITAILCQRAILKGSGDMLNAVKLWSWIGHTASGMIFILMGVTITLAMFTERWLAMLIAIAAVVIARLIGVHVSLGLLRPGEYDWRERSVIGALGMRGALTLALALMLPTDLPYWWTIQSIAYGVVLFDLMLAGPLAPVLFRTLSPSKP